MRKKTCKSVKLSAAVQERLNTEYPAERKAAERSQ